MTTSTKPARRKTRPANAPGPASADDDGTLSPEDQTDAEKQADGRDSVYGKALRLYEAGWETKITPDGRPFAVDKRTGRATVLSEAGKGSLYSLLQTAYIKQDGKPGSAEQVSQVLQGQYAMAHAGTFPTADLHLRVARTAPDTVVLDLGERHSSAHVEITPDGWTVRETALEATFELSEASRPLPHPKRARGVQPGDGYEALRKLLGWGETDRRWLLVRGWLVAALLPNVARPLLFMHGRAGSGKTLRAVFVLSVLDPREELGGSLSKNERDSMVAASARYLLGWDNITTVSEAISNMICRLVTGGTDERRSLYSNDDLHVRDIRRTGALTGINVPMMLPDALERLIPLTCGTIPKERRRSETAMRAQFAKAHPAILADVLDDLALVLRRLPRVQNMKRNRPRMADFSDVLRALGREYDRAYVRTAEGVQREVAESDPFVRTLCAWLKDNPGILGQRLAWADALNRLRGFVLGDEAREGLPTSVNGFSALLTKHAGSLEAMGYSSKAGKSNGERYVMFSAKGADG